MYLLATREDVGCGDFFNACFCTSRECRAGIAVEGECDLFAKSLVGRVVVEDEGVEDLVFGFAELGGL